MSAAVALGAAGVALRSAREADAARRTLAPAAGTDASPATPLRVRVLGGRSRRDLAHDSREYAFEIALSNASAADVTVASLTLRVGYRTRANFCGAADLAPVDTTAGDAAATGGSTFAVPVSIGAGQTITGWVHFHSANVVPRHCRVDDHSLVFTDAEGRRTLASAHLPAVLQADTDGQGPASWGWD